MAERSPFPDEEGARLEEDERLVEEIVLAALLLLTSYSPSYVRRAYANGTLPALIQEQLIKFQTELDKSITILTSTANYGGRVMIDRLASYAGSDINITSEDIDYILANHVNNILNSTNTAIEEAQLEEQETLVAVLPFIIGLNANQARKLINYYKASQAVRSLESIEITLSRMRDEALTYRASLISVSLTEDVLEEGKLIAANRIQTTMTETLYKTWNCSFINSCQVCISAHGESVPINSVFSNGLYRPKAHPHCRCALTIKEGEQ